MLHNTPNPPIPKPRKSLLQQQKEPKLEPTVTKKPPLPKSLNQLQKEIKERQKELTERYKQKLAKFKNKKSVQVKKPLLETNKPSVWGDPILQAKYMAKYLNALQLEPNNISLFNVSGVSGNDSQISYENFNPQHTSTPRNNDPKLHLQLSKQRKRWDNSSGLDPNDIMTSTPRDTPLSR